MVANSSHLIAEVREVRDERANQSRTQSSAPIPPSAVDLAVARLDAWLETMRGPDGYGGPVAHWWQQSLLYTGAGLDWRYEGIIAGYLALWERTGDAVWLHKARCAGDDLVNGQLAGGHYRASAFEINPASAGTPHEAACDAGLLMLALALRRGGHSDWQRYADCAEHNLRAYYLGQLWEAEVQAFRDDPDTPTFVPNKAATVCDALFLMAELTGDSMWVERYALPTLRRVLDHQVSEGPGLKGAIAQNSFGKRRIEKYFPLYIARCVPALARAYDWNQDGRYMEAALQAMQFIKAWISADGLLPTIIYPNGQTNRHHSWIAPLGDVLRAGDTVWPNGKMGNFQALRQRLLDGQDSSGGVQTAVGFAGQAGGPVPSVPDVRDVLHVAGWCDKAFRYLASHVGSNPRPAQSQPFEVDCVFRGKAMRMVETQDRLEITRDGRRCYLWNKGEPWAAIATQEFWLN